MLTPDPRRLHVLLAVARHGGVLAAADELGISASAVSQQIRKLEQESAHMLLRRTPSGSTLTPAGLALAEAAEDIERVLAIARARMSQQADVSGTVRVGGFTSFLVSILVPALTRWSNSYPNLIVEVVEGAEEDLLRDLRSGRVDALVIEVDAGTHDHQQPRGTSDAPLLDEPWKLVAPSGELLDTEVVDLTRSTLPWLGLEPSAASSKATERVRRLLGGPRSTAHSWINVQTALALVAAGRGITLVPSLALRGLSLDGVDALDVPGLGMRRIALRTLSSSRGPSAALETVTTLMREEAAAYSWDSGTPSTRVTVES